MNYFSIGAGSTGLIPSAMYGRYSSNMQRPASLEDQQRSCEEAAQEKGGILLPEHIYKDAAMTGTSKVGRNGLEALLKLIRSHDCPFKYVLIDDTSRLGRNLGEVLTMADLAKHHQVGLYFVAQKLDSGDPNFRLMLTVYGMSDEQQIERLKTKVHSGQKGRVLQGLSSGSRCFGYRSVPVANPDMPFATGRAAMSGVKWGIIEEEAAVIRRIFDLFGDGFSMWQITCAFNQQGIRGSRKPRIGNVPNGWNPTLIKNILRRQKYRGISVWNQTHQDKDPETGQVVTRRKKASEHVVVDTPHLRIVTDEQWNRAEARLKELSEKNSAQTLGGLNRAKKKHYLYSGVLFCGVCGEKMRITGGKGREASYECPNYRHKRGCTNALRMREDRLAQQLTDALANRLLLMENLSQLVDAVWRELDEFLDRLRREGPGENIRQLEKVKANAQAKIRRLINYITETDQPSESVRAALKETEADLMRITEQLRTSVVPATVAVSKQVLEQIVVDVVQNLHEALMGDAVRARQFLLHHIKRLVLFPGETDDGPVFEVIGEVDVFSAPDDERVLLDRSSTAMVQQHTSDHLYRFAGIQLHLRKDIYGHPLLEVFKQLFDANPELANARRDAKGWAELLRGRAKPGSELHSRINYRYVTQAFVLNRDVFDSRFGLIRDMDRHTGKVHWALKPVPVSRDHNAPDEYTQPNVAAAALTR
jgi:DNA invertase Pin-like site-specific DNA recombinase